jgi:hypothetical protein
VRTVLLLLLLLLLSRDSSLASALSLVRTDRIHGRGFVLLPDRYVLDAKVLDGDKYVVSNGPAAAAFATPGDRLPDNVIGSFVFSI